MTEPPFEHIPEPSGARAGVLFVCDHAANAVPNGYGTLGLGPELLVTHIAYDIGAAAVTRDLAARFGSAAILGRWSRLLIDLNRGPDDPTLVMKLSDGSIIPGNRDAGSGEIAHRIRSFHEPYHAAIAAEIGRIEARGVIPAVVSIHSFTPVWKDRKRKWDVAVLSDRDRRLADPLIARLTEAGFAVGDNEPYSGALEGDTLNRHGTRRGLPHVLVEIRQDRIGDEGRARAFAARLEPILKAALADMGPAERLSQTIHS
jgi:predicted N-formylglutamate amidohydrolase